MNELNKEDKLLKQLFQKQRESEGVSIPSFVGVFGKAEKKHLKMKKIKWAVIALLIALVSAIGFSKLMNEKPVDLKNIEVARASTGLYEKLMRDGKFIINDILFDYDNANIRPSSMPILHQVADMMKAHPDIRLSIEGHTDGRGSTSYNLKLSEARAMAVKMTLIQLSIAEERLQAKGFGESRPMSSDKSEGGRALNRRVEFVKI